MRRSNETRGSPVNLAGAVMPPAAEISGRTETAWADANLFVALLAGPDHDDHLRAIDLFRRVAEGRLSLIVTPVVVAEVAFAMWRRLGLDRSTIATQLIRLLQADGLVVVEGAVVERALELHGTVGGLDVVDAYLAARAELDGPPTIASFDRDFDRIEGIRRIAS